MDKKILCIFVSMLMLATITTVTATGNIDINANIITNYKEFKQNLEPWDLLLVKDIGATGETGENGNAGAEFDGTYLYSTRWASNLIHSYDKEGNLVEEFSIPGVSGLRDLAFDGTYMYGGATAGTIWGMDFNSKTLEDTINGGFQCRAIAYDSDLDVFYVKNWGDPCWIVDRDGNIVGQFNFQTVTSTYGLAYDPSGPYLWVADQGTDGTNIYQWDLTAEQFTDVNYNVGQDVGSGIGIAGGLWMSEDYASGKMCIGGCVQDSSAPGVTDWLFVYELYTTNEPPVTPAAPTGPDSGVTDAIYTFTAVTTDAESEQIYYMFDWGDGTFSDWVGPFNSGQQGTATHSWTIAGTFNVKVKAKDTNGGESAWSPAHTINIKLGPILKIGPISGGLFKVKASILNNGATEATNVEWKIEVIGGAFLGKTTTGTIPSILPSEGAEIESKLIIGIGATTVKVTATCTDSTATDQKDGFIIIIYISL